MSHTDDLKSGYQAAAEALEQDGPSALIEQDRVTLAVLYVREARKGAIALGVQPIGDSRKAFAAHLKEHFGTASQLKVTIDYQKVLLRDARAHASAPHPISAVILYATWAEHWLNAQILVSAIAKGLGATEGAQMLRDSSVPAKLGWLWGLVGLPTLPATHISALRRLFDVRNEYLHYKWSGKDPELLATSDPRLAGAIADIESTIHALRDYDMSLLDPHITVAESLMETRIRDSLRTVYDPEPTSVLEA